MPKANKLPWVPEWLVNSQRARVGLSVLVEPGKEPDIQEWGELWVQRLEDLAKEESVRDVELVAVWEELEGGQVLVRKVRHLLGLLNTHIAPGLWTQLWYAQGEGKEAEQAKKRLLAKFPQEDPAPSPEERLQELWEEGLNGLVNAVADPTPHQRVWGLYQEE
jgi:hypothetical protein